MASLIASEREARRQQRLRGAQRHQIPDVDFGLSFPAFPSTQQSNQEKTPPKVVQNSQSTAKQTPQASSNETNTPLTRSKRKASEISNEQEETESAKRKRPDDPVPSSTRSSRSQSRRDIYEFEEDEPDQDAVQELNTANSEEVTEDVDVVPKSPDATEQNGALDQEVDESPPLAPGSGRRRRSLRNRLSTTQDLESSIVQQLQAGSSPSEIQRTVQSKTPAPLSHKRTPKSQQYERDELDELDELSPEQASTGSRRPIQRLQEQFSDDIEEEEEAQEIDDHEAAKYMEKIRRRNVPDEDSLEIDELETSGDISGVSDTPVPRHTNPIAEVRKAGKLKQPSKASPSMQRHPKPKARKSKGAGDGVKKPRGDPIPITVYRLTKAPNYDEDADDADILISNVPYFKRAGANAIDVLSQVAEELIETGLSTLQDEASNANDAKTRKEWVVKLRALTHYQQEIRPRLLELSSSLDHGYSTARRIRLAQKQRVMLREDVLRIRREREELALRMDEIRTKQEEDTKYFLARNEINTAFHDIENAVERGKAMMSDEKENSSGDGDVDIDTSGLEMLLRSVAAEVSCNNDSGGNGYGDGDGDGDEGKVEGDGGKGEGGVLRRVKEFNAFLERAALVLEGRV